MTERLKEPRRQLREQAYQTLFMLEFSGTGTFLDATKAVYFQDKEETEGDVSEASIPVFLLNLVKGVLDNKSHLDTELAKHLKSGWSLERLTISDLTLLRLGLYEMAYYEDTPSRVALNEIIEIAKKYSDDTSSRFINGILTKFLIED